MGLKSLSIVLLGLALCCFLQGATAQEEYWLEGEIGSVTEGYWTEGEVEVIEEEKDGNALLSDAVFHEMNIWDGSILPHGVVELRDQAVQTAISGLWWQYFPEGPETISQIYPTEISTNVATFFRFNVQLTHESGLRFRIYATALSSFEDYELYELVDFGFIENRMGEFPQTDFKEIKEETSEFVELRSRAVNRTIDRLRDRGILPQNLYNIFEIFPTAFSPIFNMSEYPNPGDMLYRFNLRVINTTGTIFRVFATIATNYETPQYYELIDYGCIENRFGEFSDVTWKEIPEDEDSPLPDVIVQMRTMSVTQAMVKLLAKGLLPKNNYVIAKTFPTEVTVSFVHPEFNPGDVLYKFDVQLGNEAGIRYRITTIVASNERINPSYELIDYFFTENRLDEFTDTYFEPWNEDVLRKKSILEAVEKLQQKGTIPEGKYTIAETYPTRFSTKFEHPDYSNDDYILYYFTAQVKDATGVEFQVEAVVISAYEAPQYSGLIDYGILNS